MMNPFGAFRFLSAVYRLGRDDRQRYGTGLLSQLREINALRRLNSLEPSEYFQFRLSSPSLNWEHKAAYLSYNQACALHRELAPEPDRAITTKFLTERFFNWFDIPMPQTYGLFDPRFGRTAAGRSLKNLQEFREFIEQLPPDKFVLKPAASHKGAGITVIVGRSGKTLRSASGEQYSPEQLFEKCFEDWKLSFSHTSYGLLIQEYIQQHEALDKIHPHSLNTFRAITFINDAGEVEALATEVKFGIGSSMVDNVSQGGFAARVDEQGNLQWAFLENSPSDQPIEKHPTTGRQIAGIHLPHFEAAVSLAKRAQLHLPQLRTLAWDIAITDKGPVIIEVNVFWGHTIQIAIGRGLITPGLRQVLDRIKW